MDIKGFSPSTNFNISYINFFYLDINFLLQGCSLPKHLSGRCQIPAPKFFKILNLILILNFLKFFFSVFGNTGLHLILRGSVVPQTSPAYSRISETTEFPSPTPIFDEHELQVKEKVGIL